MAIHNDTSLSDAQARQKRVRIWILVVGTLVTFAMVYGSGMRAKVKEAQKIDERRKIAEQNVRIMQREMHLRLALSEQLEARRLLSAALDQLDARNFGQAQESVKTAAELLQEAEKERSTNPDFSDVAGALSQAAATTVGSSPDVATARTPIAEAARQMDEKLNPYVQDFLRKSLQSDAVNPIKAPTMNDVPQFIGNDVTRTE